MLETLKAERVACQLDVSPWEKLAAKVLPSITVVLGLPGSGCDTLAELLGQAPSTMVDCNELLDKELERRTEMGLAMHNMLAKGQAGGRTMANDHVVVYSVYSIYYIYGCSLWIYSDVCPK